MANYLYVDNSNVWIEGMHVAAFVHGMAPSVWSAVTNRIVDYTWKIDFGKLHEFAGGGDIGRAVLSDHGHPQTIRFGMLRSTKDSKLWFMIAML